MKAMVYICCDHKIILVLNQVQQLLIYGLRCVDIAIIVNMPGPPGPARFIIRERIEAAGIHVTDPESLSKVVKVFIKAFSAVSEAG